MEQPTHAMYDTFFNIHDGVLILTEFKPPLDRLSQGGVAVPTPTPGQWFEVAWQHWLNMCMRKDAKIDWDNQFPPHVTNVNYNIRAEQFRSFHAAGRPPSEHRAPLAFYSSLLLADRRNMKGFLNYIIIANVHAAIWA